MSDPKDADGKLFDQFPDQYDRWFDTPIGALVKKCEDELLSDLSQPRPGDRILDVGCGTGVFTVNILVWYTRSRTRHLLAHPKAGRAQDRRISFWGCCR